MNMSNLSVKPLVLAPPKATITAQPLLAAVSKTTITAQPLLAAVSKTTITAQPLLAAVSKTTITAQPLLAVGYSFMVTDINEFFHICNNLYRPMPSIPFVVWCIVNLNIPRRAASTNRISQLLVWSVYALSLRSQKKQTLS